MKEPSKHYETPLSDRYASKEMSYLFSPEKKFRTWRQLWLALAKGEQLQGLPITDAQINQLQDNVNNIDLNAVNELEQTFHHDVMAHIHAYGNQCPQAKAIIHLGATSSFVTDNTDLIVFKEALSLITNKLAQTLKVLAAFAKKHAAAPCLGWTHFQPAQPTTLGKRASLWIQDLLLDLHLLTQLPQNIRFLGVKGATGTQASFLTLLDGSQEKVDALEEFVTKEMGFSSAFTISSQTYPRKLDVLIINALATMATSIHKLATDIRLLSHLQEVEEPFAKDQIGSSAMPHKRNPMHSERLCSLARHLITLTQNTYHTAANQWLERTLDDSANRRITLPEAFLTADGLLNLAFNTLQNLTVFPNMMQCRLEGNYAQICLEPLLMELTKQGKDRQQMHQLLKTLAFNSQKQAQITGHAPDFLQTLKDHPEITLTEEQINQTLSPQSLVGAAPTQVYRFLSQEVDPALAAFTQQPVPIPPLSL
jgi:adenylosuccinate lyase